MGLTYEETEGTTSSLWEEKKHLIRSESIKSYSQNLFKFCNEILH